MKLVPEYGCFLCFCISVCSCLTAHESRNLCLFKNLLQTYTGNRPSVVQAKHMNQLFNAIEHHDHQSEIDPTFCSDENTALNNNDSNGVDICSSSHFNIEAHMVSIACKL